MAVGSLRASNLTFERRIKGHLPVTRLAVTDSGTVMVVVPDDHQPRLYHLTCFAATGDWREIGSFSVEKLQQIDFSGSGSIFVATTDDDVYVFRDNTKKRFFTERRDIYTAVSVSSSGDHFAVGSADMILSSHSVTLARTHGGQVWIKDLPFSVTDIRISDDGARVLAGSEDGMAVMLDEFRSLVWQFEGGDPITALGVSQSGDISVIGTSGGVVHVIGDAGNKLWDVARDGRIVDCAMSHDGQLIAIARVKAVGSGVIEFFSSDGTPVLEHDLTCTVTSVACSPNGNYAAISCDDGVLQILEITPAPGRAHTESRARYLRDTGFADAANGDHRAAVEKLTEYLTLSLADVEACAKLVEAGAAQVESLLLETERLMSDGDTINAAKVLRSAGSLLPYDRGVFDRTSEVRERLMMDSLARALSLAGEGRLEDAIAEAEEVIALDFTNCHAREVLGKLEGDLVSKYTTDADVASSAGHLADAVGLLEKALAIRPSPDIQEKLAHARAKQALEDGLALYQAKKFSQAVFQFRKALSIDPDNVEAKKYIEYSESLRQDDMLFDRFSKLE